MTTAGLTAPTMVKAIAAQGVTHVVTLPDSETNFMYDNMTESGMEVVQIAREGEAIAWHLKEVIGGDESRYHRVVFNEITKKAIERAFEKPGALNQHKVEAQQTRRFLDRVVGFMLSPLLWAKIARGLSAGRVQSVAVRLLVEREREVRVFVPEEYWEIFADTTAGKAELRLQVINDHG